MPIVFYISGHGFGHASRSIELIGALTAQRPDLQIVVRTRVHPWFFDDIRGPRVEVQPLETDTGVVQIDSLRLDEDETARRAAVFYDATSTAAWTPRPTPCGSSARPS